jgi:diguanylate cyclase (GGDEF)-like protein
MSNPWLETTNLALLMLTALAGAGAGATASHLATGNRIHELQELAHHYQHAARHDALTGLPNRTVAVEILTTGSPELVALCDLDDFKTINDRYGHAVGDQLLHHVAQRLNTALNQTSAALNRTSAAVACRLAGDEFALLWALRPAHPAAEAERLVQAVSEPVVIDGHTLHPAITIGLALASDSLNGTDLLAAADVALYDAKHQDHRVALYTRHVPPGPVNRGAVSPDRRTRSRRSPGTRS